MNNWRKNLFSSQFPDTVIRLDIVTCAGNHDQRIICTPRLIIWSAGLVLLTAASFHPKWRTSRTIIVQLIIIIRQNVAAVSGTNPTEQVVSSRVQGKLFGQVYVQLSMKTWKWGQRDVRVLWLVWFFLAVVQKHMRQQERRLTVGITTLKLPVNPRQSKLVCFPCGASTGSPRWAHNVNVSRLAAPSADWLDELVECMLMFGYVQNRKRIRKLLYLCYSEEFTFCIT